MKTGQYIEDSQGVIIGVKYESGFIFMGEFDDSRNPLFGRIKNSGGVEIYYGQIDGNIFDYFIEYNETGKIKQRPIKPY